MLLRKKEKNIILIGSYARGDSTDDSDIDILILLDDMADPISEMENISTLTLTF